MAKKLSIFSLPITPEVLIAAGYRVETHDGLCTLCSDLNLTGLVAPEKSVFEGIHQITKSLLLKDVTARDLGSLKRCGSSLQLWQTRLLEGIRSVSFIGADLFIKECPIPECDENLVLRGGLTLVRPHAGEFPHLISLRRLRITGPLAFQGDKKQVTFPKLRLIGEDFHLSKATLDLPLLRWVGGNLTLDGKIMDRDTGLGVCVGGQAVVAMDSEWNALTSIGGDLRINDSSGDRFSLASLRVVGGDFIAARTTPDLPETLVIPECVKGTVEVSGMKIRNFATTRSLTSPPPGEIEFAATEVQPFGIPLYFGHLKLDGSTVLALDNLRGVSGNLSARGGKIGTLPANCDIGADADFSGASFENSIPDPAPAQSAEGLRVGGRLLLAGVSVSPAQEMPRAAAATPVLTKFGPYSPC